MSVRKKVTLTRFLLIIASIAVFFVILLPPFLLVLTSIKTELDALSFPPKWIFQPTLQNYREIFDTSPLAAYGANSLIVASLNRDMPGYRIAGRLRLSAISV
jgi:ABC-type glycerol-3-phosphate transport system permease component